MLDKRLRPKWMPYQYDSKWEPIAACFSPSYIMNSLHSLILPNYVQGKLRIMSNFIKAYSSFIFSTQIGWIVCINYFAGNLGMGEVNNEFLVTFFWLPISFFCIYVILFLCYHSLGVTPKHVLNCFLSSSAIWIVLIKSATSVTVFPCENSVTGALCFFIFFGNINLKLVFLSFQGKRCKERLLIFAVVSQSVALKI